MRCIYFYIPYQIPQWQYIKRVEDFCVVSWIFHLHCQGPCTSRGWYKKAPNSSRSISLAFQPKICRGSWKSTVFYLLMMEHFIWKEKNTKSTQAERQRSGPRAGSSAEVRRRRRNTIKYFSVSPAVLNARRWKSEPLKRVADEKNNTTRRLLITILAIITTNTPRRLLLIQIDCSRRQHANIQSPSLWIEINYLKVLFQRLFVCDRHVYNDF